MRRLRLHRRQDPLDGIVIGDVFIDSTLQLAAYRGVTEIHGDLNVSGRSVAELGDTFDDLRVIEGSLVVGNNQQLERLVFPRLESVAVVSLYATSALATVELPALKTGTFSLRT